MSNFEDGCKNAQRVASKYGYTIICDEDQLEEAKAVAEGCANAKEVASKYGFTIVCDED